MVLIITLIIILCTLSSIHAWLPLFISISSNNVSGLTTITRINKQQFACGGYRGVRYGHITSDILGSFANNEDTQSTTNNNSTEEQYEEKDTIRVRIWRALASGNELSLSQLCKQVGERNRSDIKSHLVHVEKQAKTIRNKSDEWRIRRGLLSIEKKSDNMQCGDDSGAVFGAKKLRLKRRRGAKNEEYIRLV